MDLDKDGKLTVGEFERFAKSPNAAAFVQQMRSQKAVETWAEKMGIDAEKARAAMSIGANAQRRSTQQQRQRAAGRTAQRRRGAVANRNRRASNAQRQRNQQIAYLRHLRRVNPFLQKYYQRRRTEL
jgi:sugar diacid utilization regulator